MSGQFHLQDEAYEKGIELEHKFFIAKDTVKGGKVVTSFKTINDFLTWFDRQPSNKRHFYEKIIDERVEYYDIDGKIEDHEYWGNDKGKIIDNFLKLREEWIDTTQYNNKELNANKDLFILESKNLEYKKSFHIIIRNGFVFKNNLEQKDFINEFQSFLMQKNTGFVIDTAPYGANQCFRTIGSSKIGSDRFLVRSDYNGLSLNCDKRLFFPSWIGPELEQASEISCISLDNEMGIDENKNYLRYVEDGNQKSIDEKEEILTKPPNDEDTCKLTELIIETINDGTSPICDKEIKNKLKYVDWYKLVLAIFNSCEGGDMCKYLFSLIFPLYRHSHQISADHYYDNLYHRKGDYTTLTVASLHFLAMKHPKYKEIFPKSTFQEIMAIPKKHRTDREQQFVERITKKLDDKNIKELTHTDGFIERKDCKYVNARDINGEGIIVVKAGLGKGKTSATVNHINNFEYDCIIILTPRRAYAQSTLSRVNKEINLPKDEKFVLYSDIKGAIKHKYIIIQVESLCRFTHEFEDKNTLVILDEVESLLYQMTSHKTHGMNHIRNIEMFQSMLTNCTKVLCMDAFISNRTLNILKNINRKFKYYNYTKDLERRKAVELPKKNILKNKLIEQLEQGKKVYFFCSSRKQLTEYFLTDIRQKFPEKKILEYHSKKMTVDLDRINDEWKSADLIVTTCTITVGCNFDLENVFSNMFVYASACSRNLVRDIFQSCYRVRHIIDKTMYFCLDTRHNGMNLPTSINEIKDIINNKVLFHKNHYEKFLKMEFTEVTPKWVKDLLINNIFESNMSVMNLRLLFYKYLELCNYMLEDEDVDDLDFEEEENNLVFEDYQYTDIPSINRDQLRELIVKKKREPLSDLEEFTLNKHFFQTTLTYHQNHLDIIPIEDEISIWNVYCNYGKKKFRNLQYEKGLNAGTLRICDIISASFPEIADNLSRKLEDIVDITQKLGLKNSQDFKEIHREIIVNNIGWLEENSDRFHTNFGLRNRCKNKEFTLRNGSELLGKIFSSWGYSKIKRGKRKTTRVNGKNIDLSNYWCENTEDIDVYSYLEPKNKKKTDRKIRLLKEDDMPL